MNKEFQIFIVLFIIWMPSFAQNNQVLFEQDEYHLSDLDKKYSNGDSIRVSYSFKNISKTPVRILGIDSSCTCTVPLYTENEIEPGEKGQVILLTTYHQLSISRNVYVVVMFNTIERYHKLTLKW